MSAQDFCRPNPPLSGALFWNIDNSEKESRTGHRREDAPTYRGGEAAPEGLELTHAEVLPQAASWGGGGLHALAVRRGLRKTRR